MEMLRRPDYERVCGTERRLLASAAASADLPVQRLHIRDAKRIVADKS